MVEANQAQVKVGAMGLASLFIFIAMIGSFQAAGFGAVAVIAGICQIIAWPIASSVAYALWLEDHPGATNGLAIKIVAAKEKMGADAWYLKAFVVLVLLICLGFMAAGAGVCVFGICVGMGFYWGPVLNLIALLLTLLVFWLVRQNKGGEPAKDFTPASKVAPTTEAEAAKPTDPPVVRYPA